MRTLTRILSGVISLGLVAACTSETDKKTKPEAAAPSNGTNILHITWGGIAMADANEAKRHWSNWTINLVDGSTGYGWTSEETVNLPHELMFELAGPAKINSFAIDSRFEPVLREDGSMSQSPDGSPVHSFQLMGSTVGPQGPYAKLVEGEAKKDERTTFDLKTPVRAQWLKLVVKSNWAGSGATRLAEVEALGELESRGEARDADVSGYYTHEYGPIILRKEGDTVHGCYNDGDGKLIGFAYGRLLRLAWLAPGEVSLGMATFVPAHGKLYGFWYRDGDRMGSPWNAEKKQELKDVKLEACAAAIYPNYRAVPADTR